MKLVVDTLQTLTVRLPMRRDFRWRGLGKPLGEVLVVRVCSGEHVGYRETVPLPHRKGPFGHVSGETPAIDALVLHELVAPSVLDHGAAELPDLRTAARERVHGYPYAQAALDIALHDLAARALNVSVYELLGGRRRQSIPIAHMVGLLPVAEAIGEAEAALAEGCRALQVKGGPDPDRDVELTGALRKLGGEQVMLRVDANCGYGPWKPALNHVRALADAGADCVEQPTRALDDLRRVSDAAPIPIIADESCWSPQDAFMLAAQRAVDALSVYLPRAGGVFQSHAVTAVAAAAGLAHDLNGSLETGIGNSASLHVACASDAELWPCVLPINGPADDAPTRTFGRYFADDVITHGLDVNEGAVRVSDRPGLGIDVDVERLQHATVSSRTSHAGGFA